MTTINTLRWKKYPVLNDGFICLVDAMGDDSSIVQAARVSYGKDGREGEFEELILDVEGVSDAAITERGCIIEKVLGSARFIVRVPNEIAMENLEHLWGHAIWSQVNKKELHNKDRALIRYLLNHSHTTPFEMVELKFLVRVPMDCWRQWIRHRTANVNEYSTRYTEAIDSQQTTSPQEWRLQATDNKQGSSGYLEKWPEGWEVQRTSDLGSMEQYILYHNNKKVCNVPKGCTPGSYLREMEYKHHQQATTVYQTRLTLGIAKEQARKDLPLSTYTEAYWKCDLHNIFNFLRLRMDSHAQYEIRMYANAMAEIVKQIVPVAWEAFEDYVLHAKKFSRMEMEFITNLVANTGVPDNKPSSMTEREWKEFLGKLQ